MTTEITQRNHRREVRFFWALLFGATTVSLAGNVVHAVLKLIPTIYVQIGVATVPPIALLAAVHGIGLGVRAGASGRVYRCAVSAVGVIGVGAFALSFLALRDLMVAIGYGHSTAAVFPAIVDTAVAVSSLMLVALGDKPVQALVQTVQDPVHTDATDAERADKMIASGTTTQPVQTVIAILAARRDGASINAAAKASGINYRTAARIIQAAA